MKFTLFISNEKMEMILIQFCNILGSIKDNGLSALEEVCLPFEIKIIVCNVTLMYVTFTRSHEPYMLVKMMYT